MPLREPLLDDAARARAIACETEVIGHSILGELHSQREVLQYAARQRQLVDHDAEASGGVISRELGKVDRKRLGMVLSVIALLAIVILAIYWKVRSGPTPPAEVFVDA